MMRKNDDNRREEIRLMNQNLEDMRNQNQSLIDQLAEKERKTQELLQKFNENYQMHQSIIAQTSTIIQSIISCSNLDDATAKKLQGLLDLQSTLQKKDKDYFWIKQYIKLLNILNYD